VDVYQGDGEAPTNTPPPFTFGEREDAVGSYDWEGGVLAMERPLAHAAPDWRQVEANCKAAMDMVEGKGYMKEDMLQYIFEAVMTAIYGKDVWKWWREKEK
jgi:hypothetical protein